jgi:hypothetical protein
VTIASAPELTGSLTTVMTNLVATEQAVHPDLRVYRWRPRVPDLPCMWNWIPTAPFEQRDTARWRDNVTIQVQIGIRHTDVDDEMAKLEEYADAFREVMDAALHTMHPLGAVWAKREGMRLLGVEFGSGENAIPVLVVEFPILVRLDRMIPAS